MFFNVYVPDFLNSETTSAQAAIFRVPIKIRALVEAQKCLSPNYLTSTATRFDTFAFYYDLLGLPAGSFICENLLTPATLTHYYCIDEQ
jgi:hypothetical protein